MRLGRPQALGVTVTRGVGAEECHVVVLGGTEGAAVIAARCARPRRWLPVRQLVGSASGDAAPLPRANTREANSRERPSGRLWSVVHEVLYGEHASP